MAAFDPAALLSALAVCSHSVNGESLHRATVLRVLQRPHIKAALRPVMPSLSPSTISLPLHLFDQTMT